MKLNMITIGIFFVFSYSVWITEVFRKKPLNCRKHELCFHGGGTREGSTSPITNVVLWSTKWRVIITTDSLCERQTFWLYFLTNYSKFSGTVMWCSNTFYHRVKFTHLILAPVECVVEESGHPVKYPGTPNNIFPIFDRNWQYLGVLSIFWSRLGLCQRIEVDYLTSWWIFLLVFQG